MIDIDDDPYADIVVFGKSTRYGLKFTGVGHDGEKQSIRQYLADFAKLLHERGHYLEVSEKLAEILLNKFNVPTVEDEQDIEDVLGKKVDFVGTVDGMSGYGWYYRTIGGKQKAKILVGKPNV